MSTLSDEQHCSSDCCNDIHVFVSQLTLLSHRSVNTVCIQCSCDFDFEKCFGVYIHSVMSSQRPYLSLASVSGHLFFYGVFVFALSGDSASMQQV